MHFNATAIIYRTFLYTIRRSVHAGVMATPINLQQFLFTASSEDLPFSNTILEKKCVLVGVLRLKWIWAGIHFNRSRAAVSVAMVTRHHVIETPLYAMQDGDEWLKVNASRIWLRARGAPILHRKDGSLRKYGNLRIEKIQVVEKFWLTTENH